jgi:hypothetical protein
MKFLIFFNSEPTVKFKAIKIFTLRSSKSDQISPDSKTISWAARRSNFAFLDQKLNDRAETPQNLTKTFPVSPLPHSILCSPAPRSTAPASPRPRPCCRRASSSSHCSAASAPPARPRCPRHGRPGTGYLGLSDCRSARFRGGVLGSSDSRLGWWFRPVGCPLSVCRGNGRIRGLVERKLV